MYIRGLKWSATTYRGLTELITFVNRGRMYGEVYTLLSVVRAQRACSVSTAHVPGSV